MRRRFRNNNLDASYQELVGKADEILGGNYPHVDGMGVTRWGGAGHLVAFRKGYAGLSMRDAGVLRGTITHAAWKAGQDVALDRRKAARAAQRRTA
jgi:hypothetical protein